MEMRKRYKVLRQSKGFIAHINKMLVEQSGKCNICLCSLITYERSYYSYPDHLYEYGQPLYGKPRYEDNPVPRYEVDHIIPISKGGTNNFENFQLLCRPCNIKKGSKIC